jgi:hypothetical protein
MTDHDPAHDTEHLADDVRGALLEPNGVESAARERAITAALAEFDRSRSGVVDLETARRQRYSRSLSAAAAVLVVAVGISVIVPDGGDDASVDIEMSTEALTEEPLAEMSVARSADVDDAPDVMSAEPKADASTDAALAATEAAPVIEQSEQLRVADTSAELHDLASVWWERIRAGVAEPPTGHSCLVAGASAVAIAEYRGIEVVVFVDGAEGITTALDRDDCSAVERVVPDP